MTKNERIKNEIKIAIEAAENKGHGSDAYYFDGMVAGLEAALEIIEAASARNKAAK